jgi:hypothetical protein
MARSRPWSTTRALWPDTLAVAGDGFLYGTANQLHRQPRFHEGKDLRQKPYVLFRVRIDASPVRLKSIEPQRGVIRKPGATPRDHRRIPIVGEP